MTNEDKLELYTFIEKIILEYSEKDAELAIKAIKQVILYKRRKAA